MEIRVQSTFWTLLPQSYEALSERYYVFEGDLYTRASFIDARIKELGMKLCARADEIIQDDTLVLKPFRRHGLQWKWGKRVLLTAVSLQIPGPGADGFFRSVIF